MGTMNNVLTYFEAEDPYLSAGRIGTLISQRRGLQELRPDGVGPDNSNTELLGICCSGHPRRYSKITVSISIDYRKVSANWPEQQLLQTVAIFVEAQVTYDPHRFVYE